MPVYNCSKCGMDITCPRCNGTGAITKIQGLSVDNITCPVCKGWGKDRHHKCPAKSGSGRITRRVNQGVNVNVVVQNKNK
jgi:DnaJ-class molecular chaperone